MNTVIEKSNMPISGGEVLAIPKNMLRIGGIALLLTAVAALLINPLNTDDVLDRCQDLYQRGEYATCSQVLTKRLSKNPDWHEGRKLLVEAQLADKDLLGAISHFLYLLEADKDGNLEASLLNHMGQSEEEVQQQVRELLEKILAAQPSLLKTREFAIQFELEVNNISGALEHLYTLAAEGMSSRELEGKVTRSCSDYSQWVRFMDELLVIDPQLPWPREMKLLYALEHENIELAGKILDEILTLGSPPDDLYAKTYYLALKQDLVIAMDVAIKTNQSSWVEDVLAQVEQCEPDQIRSQLPGLLDLLPDEPRLQVLSALFLLPPDQGLQQLLVLENQGYVPSNPEIYVEEKVRLLRHAQIFDFKYLKFLSDRYMPPTSLIDLAIELWQTNSQGLLDLADHLVELQLDGVDDDILKDMAAYSQPIPQVVWQRPGPQPYFLSISPNGKWLICNYTSETLVVNLNTGKETILDVVTGQWHWSPDSRQVVGLEAGSIDNVALTLTVKNGSIENPKRLTLPENYWPMGWLNNNSLAIVSSTNTYTSRVAKINVNTRKLHWLSTYREGWPTLNHAGELTWIVPDRGSLHLETAKSTQSYLIYEDVTDFDHFDFITPLDWFPGDRKVLFADFGAGITGTCCRALDLDTGDYSTCGVVSQIYSPGNWADSQSIWDFHVFFVGSSYTPFVKVNLGTGQRDFAGLILPRSDNLRYCSTEKLVAVTGGENQGVQVYKMP